MNKTELKDRVKKFIVKVQLIKAFELLEIYIINSSFDYSELSNTITLNKTELNFTKQQWHNRIISEVEFKKTQIKISDAILYILDNIHDNDNVDNLNGIQHFESQQCSKKENINSIIVDDEVYGIKTLEHMLNDYCPNVSIIETFQSSKDAIGFIKNQKPDLLFLDIHMPFINGLELLNQLGHKNYNAIFTTAHKKHMLEALRLNAIDYLMKPIDKVDLINAVERVKEQISGNLSIDQILIALEQSKPNYYVNQYTRFGIKCKNIIKYVQFREICYFRSIGGATLVALVDGKIIDTTDTIKDIEKRLPNKYFFRCNVDNIINKLNIKEFDGRNHSVNMVYGKNISISKDRNIDFKNFIKGF